jgi:hypothetical protein
VVLEVTELQDPIQSFVYALKAPETKRKYPQRLKFFFDSLFPNLDINTQAKGLVTKAKGNDQFVYSTEQKS